MNSAEIKLLREQRGLTQEEAAHQIGVTTVTWNKWENDRVVPSKMGRMLLNEWAKRGKEIA